MRLVHIVPGTVMANICVFIRVCGLNFPLYITHMHLCLCVYVCVLYMSNYDVILGILIRKAIIIYMYIYMYM